MVLMTTAPQPSSNALPITLAFVPGGPEPMMNGLGSFIPSTVVASVGIVQLNSVPATSAPAVVASATLFRTPGYPTIITKYKTNATLNVTNQAYSYRCRNTAA